MMGIAETIGSSFSRAPWGWALLGTVVLALIKVWPILTQQAITASAAIREEKRKDKTSCEERVDAMTVRLDKMAESVHLFQMQLVGALAAYRILDVCVEADDPDSLALRQARQVMSTTFAVTPSTTNGSGASNMAEASTQ